MSTHALGKATIARTLCVIDGTWQRGVMWARPNAPWWTIVHIADPIVPIHQALELGE
jgi:hypothetical protein